MNENYSRNPWKLMAFAVLLLFSFILQAQSSGRPGSSLEVRLNAHQLTNGVPDTFSFVFVNVGDHEVRVPALSPCMGGRYSGTLILELEFSPSGPPMPGKGGGCGGGVDHMPGILEQSKLWRSLKPGESLTMTYKRSELFVYEQGPGAYDFWAEYRPPALTVEDITALQQAGIDFPRQVLRSAHLHFHRARGLAP
jgi:hypothetical protein